MLNRFKDWLSMLGFMKKRKPTVTPVIVAPPATYAARKLLGANMSDVGEWLGQPFANAIEFMRGWLPLAGGAYCPQDGVAVDANGWPTVDCRAALGANGMMQTMTLNWKARWTGTAAGVDNYNVTATVTATSANTANITLPAGGSSVEVLIRAGTKDIEIIPASLPFGTRFYPPWIEYMHLLGPAMRAMKSANTEELGVRHGQYTINIVGATGAMGPFPYVGGGSLISNTYNAGTQTNTLVVECAPWGSDLFFGPLVGGANITSITATYNADPSYSVGCWWQGDEAVVKETAQRTWASRPLSSQRLGNNYQGVGRGYSYEALIALANARYAAHPEDNIYFVTAMVDMDDAATTAWVQLHKDTLDPNIEVHFCPDNEPWNAAYKHWRWRFTYAQQLGNAAPYFLRWDTQTDPLALLERHVMWETCRIGDAVAAIYGAQAGVKAFVGYEYQLGTENRAADALLYAKLGINKLHRIHEIGGALYTNVNSAYYSVSRTPAEMYAALETGTGNANDLPLTERGPHVKRGREVAAAFSKRYYLYEAGIHTNGPDPVGTVAAFLQTSPEAEQHVKNQIALAASYDVYCNLNYSAAIDHRLIVNGGEVWNSATAPSLAGLMPKGSAYVEMAPLTPPAINLAATVPGTFPATVGTYADGDYTGNYPIWINSGTGNRWAQGVGAGVFRSMHLMFYVPTAGTYTIALTGAGTGGFTVNCHIDNANFQAWTPSNGHPNTTAPAAGPTWTLALAAGCHSISLVASLTSAQAFGVASRSIT